MDTSYTSTLYEFQYSSNFFDISWGKRFCFPNTWIPSMLHVTKKRIGKTENRIFIIRFERIKKSIARTNRCFFDDSIDWFEYSLFRYEQGTDIVLIRTCVERWWLRCQQFFFKFCTYVSTSCNSCIISNVHTI